MTPLLLWIFVLFSQCVNVISATEYARSVRTGGTKAYPILKPTFDAKKKPQQEIWTKVEETFKQANDAIGLMRKELQKALVKEDEWAISEIGLIFNFDVDLKNIDNFVAYYERISVRIRDFTTLKTADGRLIASNSKDKTLGFAEGFWALDVDMRVLYLMQQLARMNPKCPAVNQWIKGQKKPAKKGEKYPGGTSVGLFDKDYWEVKQATQEMFYRNAATWGVYAYYILHSGQHNRYPPGIQKDKGFTHV